MSVDALQLLTKQIVAEVHDLVTFPPREGTHYDLLESLYTAFGQGLAIVGGLINATSPINRIPPELLVNIFALSPERYSPMSQLPYWPFMEPRMDDLHKLPKVCRYWRELALGTPTLWNHVVTLPSSQGHKSRFGHSIYLPDDVSVDLNVHFSPRTNSRLVIERMAEFMLANAPRIRELHAWDASPIVELPLFLESFGANVLEHCTISQRMPFDVPIDIPYPRGRRLFSSSGGTKLRSLCLNDVQFLPENAFPALTLLKIGFVKRRSANWVIEDLVKFLTGSPKLEEVYVHNVPYSERKVVDKSPPFTLSHLQFLAFTYSLDIDYKAPTRPIDLLLSRISIPSTCHMYFPVPNSSEQTDTKSVADILATVCRHVPGKSAVSHFLLQLTGRSTIIQFMFRHGGSLRLQILGSGYPFSYGEVQRACPDLLVTMEELRIHYDSDDTLEAAFSARSLTTFFPNVRAISIICPVSTPLQRNPRPGSLNAGLALLVPPRPSSVSTSAEDEDVDEGAPPFPALDTLWVAVNASDEIEELEATLAARAALGLPIRRLVVTLRYSPSPPGHSNSDYIACLRALRVLVEEVIVMDREHCGALEEVDWLVRLPERYDLPSSIHRDWPAVWGAPKY